MIPLGITLEGFLSYRDQQKLEFDGAPLWVLAGSNGVGKSAIFDAITFALYDRHRAGGQNADALINHHRDGLVVEFDFLLEGCAYRIRRTVRRRGRTVQTTREAFHLIPSADGMPPRVDPIPDTISDAGFNRWVQKLIGLNYEAFTSSVLLLQGQSEKLLKATTSDRYRILAELIDLSRYQELHKRVEDRRREWAGQARWLQNQLPSLPRVGDEDLEAARTALELAEHGWKAIQDGVDRLATFLVQASQWEGLERERRECQDKLTEATRLLQRADEIDAGFARSQELEQRLPQLRSILDQRTRLAEQTQRIEALQQVIETHQTALDEAQAAHTEAIKKCACLAREIGELQAEGTWGAARIADHAPVVAKLSQWESTQPKLKQLEGELASLPPDLEQALQQAEAQDRWLEEAQRALPWLKHLAEARRNLAEARDREQVAASHLADVESELQACQEQREPFAAVLETERSEADQLSHAVTRAQTRHDAAVQRRDRFATVVGEERCSLCGQPITEAHAARERERLSTDVAAGARELRDQKAAHQAAAERMDQRAAGLNALDQRIAGLGTQRHNWEAQRSQARKEARQFGLQIRAAFGNLPAPHQSRLSAEAPESDANWLATVYPTREDLEGLEQQVRGRSALAKQMDGLRKHQQRRQWLDAQRQGLRGQAAALRATFDMEAALQARLEQKGLEERRALLERQLEERGAAHQQAGAELERIDQLLQACHETKEKCERTLVESCGTRNEIHRAMTAAIEALPEPWRAEAEALEPDKLEQRETERACLASYAGLAVQLDAARRSVDGLQARIAELTAQIHGLPEEARRLPVRVEEELESARTERERADAARREAERIRAELERQREQRQQCEAQLCAAERQQHLHSRLADLLGPRGLQLTLLRRAERTIVDLANETLCGVSRGRMHLELRGAGGTSEGQSDKALDLVVFNYETGTQPIAVALASGSQKFRIAVSLALAIGRYAGQEARRIQSVIIDEGFGSLDKNGRDDMIQELHELQQQVKRVILVSHQEEFTDAFTNGYDVKLIDGTSRVSLLERA